MSDLLVTIYTGVLTIFNIFVDIIFAPIDALLMNVIPDYNSMSIYVSNFLSYFEDTFYFVVSWINIPKVAIGFILGYITFRVTLFFGTLAFRLFIKWYNALKL